MLSRKVTPSPMSPALSESQFLVLADQLLERIDAALNASAEADEAGIDCEINAGILTLTFDDDSRIVVNRQTPMREIWLASKGGGFHFRFDGASWRDTRGGGSLESILRREVSAQAGRVMDITF